MKKHFVTAALVLNVVVMPILSVEKAPVVVAAPAPAMTMKMSATNMMNSLGMNVVTDFVKSMTKRDAAMLVTGSLLAYMMTKADMIAAMFTDEDDMDDASYVM